MPSQLRDKNDIKIFILYLLRHIGYPLDFVSINDIVVQDGYVGYFDFVECFAELLETGNIVELSPEEGKEELYEITPQGIHVADNLDSRLLSSIREKSLKSALRLLSFRERGAKVKFDFFPIAGGRFTASCVISEKGDELMNVTLTLESSNQLERIRHNFYDRPEVVYKGVLAVLTGEVNYLIE
ncbi:MAG: DUF4364 family protein [Clostridia bacterium]|nr:DUF4364 family protein [Clostridia bacterium]